jgi:hypothetical protein
VPKGTQVPNPSYDEQGVPRLEFIYDHAGVRKRKDASVPTFYPNQYVISAAAWCLAGRHPHDRHRRAHHILQQGGCPPVGWPAGVLAIAGSLDHPLKLRPPVVWAHRWFKLGLDTGGTPCLESWYERLCRRSPFVEHVVSAPFE